MERAGEIAQNVDDVWIIDGRSPSRILELLNSGKTVGTKIMES
jgi:isopentenyl phosphate kinase